jgi:hypothetical protein
MQREWMVFLESSNPDSIRVIGNWLKVNETQYSHGIVYQDLDYERPTGYKQEEAV